jgi:hypothetical protein
VFLLSQSQAHPNIELFSRTLKPNEMFKLTQFAAPKKPGMLGRAVAVSMLPPVVFTSLPPSWFSASPPVGLNFFFSPRG